MVWKDRDRDGQQDNNEPRILNAVVQLLDSSNVVLSTQLTTASGNFLWNGLAAESYKIKVLTPFAGWPVTVQNVGNDATDSDIATSNNRTALISVAANQVVGNIGAGFYNPAEATPTPTPTATPSPTPTQTPTPNPTTPEPCAQFVDYEGPSELAPGQGVYVSVNFRNCGQIDDSWENGDGDTLIVSGVFVSGHHWPWSSVIDVRIAENEDVEPGETYGFLFYIVAPDIPGDYELVAQMTHELFPPIWMGFLFGEEFRKTIRVRVPPNAVSDDWSLINGEPITVD